MVVAHCSAGQCEHGWSGPLGTSPLSVLSTVAELGVGWR